MKKKEQTIGEFAESLGMTFKQFDTHFAQTTGKTPLTEIWKHLG